MNSLSGRDEKDEKVETTRPAGAIHDKKFTSNESVVSMRQIYERDIGVSLIFLN